MESSFIHFGSSKILASISPNCLYFQHSIAISPLLETTKGTTLGTTASIKYEKSTLKKLPSKGNYYYVICTKPHELRRNSHDKQKRLSTKTRDHREASKLWDKLEREIYAEFDKALQRDPYLEVVSRYWDESTLGSLDNRLNEINATDAFREMNHESEVQEFMDSQGLTERPITFLRDLNRMESETITDYDKRYPVPYSERYKVHLAEDLIAQELVDRNSINNLFEYLNESEALDVRDYQNLMMPENPYPLHLQQRSVEEEAAEASTSLDALR